MDLVLCTTVMFSSLKNGYNELLAVVIESYKIYEEVEYD